MPSDSPAWPQRLPPADAALRSVTFEIAPDWIAMNTDYSAAITGLVLLIVVLTGMVGYLLTRPSDLPNKP